MALSTNQIKRLTSAGATAEVILVVAEMIERTVTGVTENVTGKKNGVTATVTAKTVTRGMTPAERARKYREKRKSGDVTVDRDGVTLPVTPSPTPPSLLSKTLENKGFEGSKKETTRATVTATVTDEAEIWFPLFWKKKPNRSGNNPKDKAFAKFVTLLRHGVTGKEIVTGVTRYAKFCDVTEKVGTPYTLMAITWLNQGGWKQEWALPEGKTEGKLPDQWVPNEQTLTPFTGKGLTMEVFESELLKFRNYHQGKGTKAVDWNPLYSNWMIKVEEDGRLTGA